VSWSRAGIGGWGLPTCSTPSKDALAPCSSGGVQIDTSVRDAVRGAGVLVAGGLVARGGSEPALVGLLEAALPERSPLQPPPGRL